LRLHAVEEERAVPERDVDLLNRAREALHEDVAEGLALGDRVQLCREEDDCARVLALLVRGAAGSSGHQRQHNDSDERRDRREPTPMHAQLLSPLLWGCNSRSMTIAAVQDRCFVPCPSPVLAL